jgi:hypothetical protein
MTDDLVKRLREYCDGNNDLMDAAADRIEELEAALRRISHAPHGKVFNAHGHEEAYLIACKALEEKNGLATKANKEMFKWINAQSHWKPDQDIYTVVLMKPDGLPETNLTYSFERAWEYATNYKEEVMYFLKQMKEKE